MRVAVVGAGAIGGWIAARLAQARVDVSLLARGEHLCAIRAQGLVIRRPEDTVVVRIAAEDDPQAIGPCDLVFFCVKSYDADQAATALPPLLDAETAIVPLLNGIDHLDLLADAAGPEHVLGGMAAVFAERVGPGVIEVRGGPDTIAIGELDGHRTPRAERVLEVCRAAGLADDLFEDILAVMWQKLAFICAQAGLTAVTRLPLGEIRASPPTFELFRRILDEVLAVAVAEGIAIREGAAERLHSFAAEALEPGAHSSLHDDLVAGRRMELDALHGAVLRHARRNDLPVPACEIIYSLLAPWAARNAALFESGAPIRA